MDVASGVQSILALCLVEDATVTATVPITMIAVLMFHPLLTTNTAKVVSSMIHCISNYTV